MESPKKAKTCKGCEHCHYIKDKAGREYLGRDYNCDLRNPHDNFSILWGENCTSRKDKSRKK